MICNQLINFQIVSLIVQHPTHILGVLIVAYLVHYLRVRSNNGPVTDQEKCVIFLIPKVLKLIFYKNKAKLPIVTQNLHDPAPIFQTNTHQNLGMNRTNFLEE